MFISIVKLLNGSLLKEILVLGEKLNALRHSLDDISKEVDRLSKYLDTDTSAPNEAVEEIKPKKRGRPRKNWLS